MPATVDRAVILAAGRGTRMLRPDPSARLEPAQAAAADSGAKGMVPFGRPFLDYVLSALADGGIREVAIVVAPGSSAIRDHYASSPPQRVRVTFAVQPDPIGTADALLAAEAFAGSGGFLALNCDNSYPVSAIRALVGMLAGDRGVGTFGGSEDQTAILCCRSGEIAQYAFCPVRHERSMPLASDWSFVVASSGVAADKTGDARESYNRLSLAVAAILALWNRSAGRADASLFAALSETPDAPARIRSLLRLLPVEGFSREALGARLDQFLEETVRIVPAVADLLEKGEVGMVGDLVDRSQALAEQALGNQVPETIALARLARELGAAGASAFGGGFGGSVWALVRTEGADAFRRRWADRYAAAFPAVTEQSRFFITRPGPAVVAL